MKAALSVLGFLAFVVALIAGARFAATPAGAPTDAPRAAPPPTRAEARTTPPASVAPKPNADAARERQLSYASPLPASETPMLASGRDPPVPALFVWRDDKATEKIALAGKRKRPALLHLWASWCGPCRKELPDILERGRKGDLDVIAITVDDFFYDVRKAFPDGIPPEIVWDKTITIERSLGVRNIPTTFLIDTSGRVRDRFDGAHEWLAQDVNDRIEKTLAIK